MDSLYLEADTMTQAVYAYVSRKKWKAWPRRSARNATPVITAFTAYDDRAQVLITTFAVGSTGPNIQQKCWRVHMIESAHNLGAQAQALGRALGRALRVGNPSSVVWLYEYFVDDSFDSRAL